MANNKQNNAKYINLNNGSGWYLLNGEAYEFVAPQNIPYVDALAYAKLQGRPCDQLRLIDVEQPLWEENILDIDWDSVLPELHLYKSHVMRPFGGEYYHIAVVAPTREIAQIGITQILREDTLYPLDKIDEEVATYQAIYRISAGFLPHSSSDSKYFRLILNSDWTEIQKGFVKPFEWKEVADQFRDVPLGMYKFQGITVQCVDYNAGHKYKTVIVVAAGVHEAIRAVRDLFPDLEEQLPELRIQFITGFSESSCRTVSYGGMPFMDHENVWYIAGANVSDNYIPHVGHSDKYHGISEKKFECIDSETREKRVYFTLNRFTMESYNY